MCGPQAHGIAPAGNVLLSRWGVETHWLRPGSGVSAGWHSARLHRSSNGAPLDPSNPVGRGKCRGYVAPRGGAGVLNDWHCFSWLALRRLAFLLACCTVAWSQARVWYTVQLCAKTRGTIGMYPDGGLNTQRQALRPVASRRGFEHERALRPVGHYDPVWSRRVARM